MRFRPLSGLYYWIESGTLRLTAKPPSGMSWRYESVTASPENFTAFLREAEDAGLAASSVSEICREMGVDLL